MTQPAYTDADVDLVADAIVDARLQGHRDWSDRIACAVLDALVERGQGLAPVIAHQWSVRYPGGVVDSKSFTEAGARQWADTAGGEVVYRAVGPWIATPSEEPA